MRLSVILVHYQTPALAARAVAAVRGDLERSGLDGEVLIVDNGSDENGRARLGRLPARIFDPGENLGFAGGANLGVREAKGDLLFLLNPDVEVLPGCLAGLVGALEGGAEIAGPRFYWDRERRLLLPPTERRTRLDELASALAGRSGGGGAAARCARSRWRRHARRHWLAEGPLPSHDLSGGLLAFRRSAWRANGPFDEGYRLYFEETDWLLRAEARGLPALYVPAAEAVHSVGASAEREPEARRWFEESAARFRRRRYGWAFSAALERLAAGGGRNRPGMALVSRAPLGEPLDLSGSLSPPPSARGGAAGRPLWIELSPQPSGFPAASERLPNPAPGSGPSASWRLPEEIRRRWTRAPLYLRLVDGEGRELESRELVPEAGAELAQDGPEAAERSSAGAG